MNSNYEAIKIMEENKTCLDPDVFDMLKQLTQDGLKVRKISSLGY